MVQFKREVVSLQAINKSASIVFGRYADAELLSEREIRAESLQNSISIREGLAFTH